MPSSARRRGVGETVGDARCDAKVVIARDADAEVDRARRRRLTRRRAIDRDARGFKTLVCVGSYFDKVLTS